MENRQSAGEKQGSGRQKSGSLPAGNRGSGRQKSGSLPAGNRGSGRQKSGSLPAGNRGSGRQKSGSLPVRNRGLVDRNQAVLLAKIRWSDIQLSGGLEAKNQAD